MKRLPAAIKELLYTRRLLLRNPFAGASLGRGRGVPLQTSPSPAARRRSTGAQRTTAVGWSADTARRSTIR